MNGTLASAQIAEFANANPSIELHFPNNIFTLETAAKYLGPHSGQETEHRFSILKTRREVSESICARWTQWVCELWAFDALSCYYVFELYSYESRRQQTDKSESTKNHYEPATHAWKCNSFVVIFCFILFSVFLQFVFFYQNQNFFYQPYDASHFS